jgi:hypothetical protein
VNPWLETLAVIGVAVLGISLGRAFSRLRKPHWLWGSFLSFALIVILILTRQNGALHFARTFSWIAIGRAKFILLALASTTGLVTPLSRLPRQGEKLLACVMMVIVATWFSVLPFLVPALTQDSLSNLQTKFDADGICRQGTGYTCGPAAAVTALNKLGLSASEGRIARLAHSSPVAGTLPGCLCAALRNCYAERGLTCRYRRFDSIAQLKNAGLTLAIIRDAFLLDHCVAVLDVSDDRILVGDPLAGLRITSREEFERIWRFCGIVLDRDSAERI